MPDPWDPIDITYITCVYTPVSERASYHNDIEPIGSYAQMTVNGRYGDALVITDNSHAPAISKDATNVPTYPKVGTP